MLSINTLHQTFELYLKENKIVKNPQTLYNPFNYIMSIGGKRMRPLLTLLACQLFDENIKQALPAALSVEVFHNFSLVHDDIMDEALLRRGHITVHEKYGLNSAILSGDAMLIYSYDMLQQTPNKSIIGEMVNILGKVAIKVCEGQQYDIDFESGSNISLDAYLKMIEMKTAVLLAGSLELGALAGGASLEDRKHLSEFGRLTGLAFQIQDDYLDTFGDPSKFGKRIGGDIAQNKKTCLYIKALELADTETKTQLLSLYNTSGNEEHKIKTVTMIFRRLAIPDFIKHLRNDYQQKAYQQLELVNAPAEAKALIKNLAASLLVREL